MNSIFEKPKTNDGDYLHRSLKNDCGVEPQSFLPKTSLKLIITRSLNFY